MKQFIYQIGDPNGMHARPAGALATFAKQFSASVRIQAGEKQVDGKRLLALMSLGATHGTVLTFTVEGEDEDLAAKRLEDFCREQLSGSGTGGLNTTAHE